MLGHLPVLASAWVTQYAKHAADSLQQQVALIRVQAGHASIELILPRTAPARTHSRVGQAPPSADATFEGALAQAQREAALILVRVDEPAENELLQLPMLDGVTLLTGADDAAVVASYRAIKHLSQHLNSQGREHCSLRLAIMGAEQDRADEAESKLRAAADMFLSCRIEPASKVAKIGACSTVTLHRSPTSLPLAQLLASIGAPQQASAVQHAPAAPAAVEPAAAAATTDSTPEAHSPAVTQATAAVVSSASSLIENLRLIDIKCPAAAGVELATDSVGGLHLVSVCDAEHPDAGARLLAAASWASDHATLLARAFPELKLVGADFTPTLHVLSANAKSLRVFLDTAIRAHVIVSTTVGGHAVRIAHPLN